MNTPAVSTSGLHMKRIRFYQNPHSDAAASISSASVATDPQEFIAVHFESDGLTIKSVENTLKEFSDEDGACYFQKSVSLLHPSLSSVDLFWPLESASLIVEFEFELESEKLLDQLAFSNGTSTDAVCLKSKIPRLNLVDIGPEGVEVVARQVRCFPDSRSPVPLVLALLCSCPSHDSLVFARDQ